MLETVNAVLLILTFEYCHVSQKTGHALLCLITRHCGPVLIILSLSHSQMKCR